jgi:hypothetical protein
MNEIFEKAISDVRSISAALEAELKRLDGLAAGNSVAEHMAKVSAGNLAELGQQLDDVHQQIATARVELKAANEQAKQVIANAQNEAAAIKRAADKQAEDIIQTARAKIEKAHAHLGV